MKKSLLSIISILSLTLLFSGCVDSTGAEEQAVLHAYVGAGMQMPMDEIALEFEEKYGIKVEYDYSGSGALLSKIVASNQGDIFMPGDCSYVYQLQEKEMITEYANVTKHIPVIAVQKGNPKNITGLSDLGQDGLELALGDDSISIGKLFSKILAKAETKGVNVTEAVNANTVVTGATVKQVLLYVSEQNVDAAVVWKADAYENSDTVDIVPIESEFNIVKTVPISILSTTENYENAKLFYDFVNDEGKEIFEKHGFVALE
ncbi:molybdate ABC transporter substrate-binding protein [Methanococcus maripaludis]|uniref:Molybdate transport system substrate-binding protein n=2 Tax=Methanococcus maripaludis TaxID=39152 RepID=A0A7J9PID8_METMI|nr:molybdate ABC transporter substrate-binding protein [Methanococcus maripaludis]MBA2862881.1 molybdate transport system substrate-binding protein [Methanococcus maripaludis]